MGFFSKVCAKTHFPVIHHGYGNDWHSKYPDFFDVVALYPNGKTVEGVYDGYGRVGGVEIEYSDWDQVKFVLKKHYKGEPYKDLPPSHDEMAQGHFMAEDFILFCQKHPEGLKNYSAYKAAFKKYANW
jgi:hypothetical protein